MDERTCQNCITDDIKSCINGGLMIYCAEICLFMVLSFKDSTSFLRFTLIFMKMQIR